jgi:acyl carrier protein
MSETEVRAKVRSYIIERFPAAAAWKISDDQSLLTTGVIDSLGILDLAAHIDSEFGVTLADDDLNPENFDSISSIARFLHAKKTA